MEFTENYQSISNIEETLQLETCYDTCVQT